MLSVLFSYNAVYCPKEGNWLAKRRNLFPVIIRVATSLEADTALKARQIYLFSRTNFANIFANELLSIKMYNKVLEGKKRI